MLRKPPFCPEKPGLQISALGEVSLIHQINLWLGEVSPNAPYGMGDDCAVLTPPKNSYSIITTDALTWGKHFDDSVSAEQAGSKLIKRNLSDIAAMGGKPESAVLALLCGPDLSQEWLKAFFAGIKQTCLEYDVRLVGGDVSSIASQQFSSVLTLTGSCLQPVLRGQTQVGDYICVTGSLGGSLREKHYAFKPRLAEGAWLAKSGFCSAMMDITDGLAKDLPSLLSDETAAALNLDAIPLSDCAMELADALNTDPIASAFVDGEDYELLVTIRKDCDIEQLKADWCARFPDVSLSWIGRVIERDGDMRLFDQATKQVLPWSQGFEHLRQT